MKHHRARLIIGLIRVAPRVGAWIETVHLLAYHVGR